MEAPVAGSRLSPYITGNSSNGDANKSVQGKGNVVNKVEDEILSVDQTTIKAFPNPFSHQTLIEVATIKTGMATVTVHDVTGRVIRTLFRGTIERGSTRRFQFEGRSLSSGIYFVRLASAGGVVNYKVIKR
jgi:hypothetical protein